MLFALSHLSVGALLPSVQRTPTPAQGAASQGFVQQVQSSIAIAALAGVLSGAVVPPAFAKVGTNVETIPLQVKGYQEITCPEALRQGRAGGALGAGAGASGIAQKCVEVKARANNPSQNDYLDVGVFGLVTETSSSMSTLGNGQDGKNDAGQFAMIDKIPAGENDLTFVFVSQQNTDCRSTRTEKCPIEGKEPLVPLTFEKMKAISYPGGDRYKVYDECEQNEFAEGC